MRAFDRCIEQFYDDEIFADVGSRQAAEINNTYTETERKLMYLLYTKGYKTMGDISKYFQLPKSTTNFIVNKLVKGDILEIHRGASDKRVKEVHLSNHGTEMAGLVSDNLNGRFDKMISNAMSLLHEKMTEEELKVVRKAVDLVLGPSEKLE